MEITPVSNGLWKKIWLPARITAHITAMMELTLADHAQEGNDLEEIFIPSLGTTMKKFRMTFP